MRARSGQRRISRFVLGAVAVATIGMAATPRAAEAQVLPAALGFLGGFFGGTYITAGIYVLKSRATGWRLHGTEDVISVRPEMLPMAVTPIAAAVMGYQSSSQLGASAAWGGVGLLSGGLIGAGFGHLIWGTTEGRWAGGTIGSAAGLAIGAIIGALTYRTDPEGQGGGGASAPLFRMTIPIGGR